jgi:hypothetical protein
MILARKMRRIMDGGFRLALEFWLNCTGIYVEMGTRFMFAEV